jgi:hypothetical protein
MCTSIHGGTSVLPATKPCSPSLAVVQMFAETWRYSGESSRRRMERWVAHYEQNNVYPPPVIAQIRAAIDPEGAHKAAAAKRSDPRQRRQIQPIHAAPAVLAHAQPPRLDMPAHAVRMPPYAQNAPMNGAVMPPRLPGAQFMPGMILPAPTLGTSFAGVRLQVCGGQEKFHAAPCHDEFSVDFPLRIARICCCLLCKSGSMQNREANLCHLRTNLVINLDCKSDMPRLACCPLCGPWNTRAKKLKEATPVQLCDLCNQTLALKRAESCKLEQNTYQLPRKSGPCQRLWSQCLCS